MSHFSTACSAIAAGIALFAAFPDTLPQGSLINTAAAETAPPSICRSSDSVRSAADRVRRAAAHANAPHSG